MWRHHRMKCGNSVPDLKLMRSLDIVAQRVDNPCNVIAAVERLVDLCEMVPVCKSQIVFIGEKGAMPFGFDPATITLITSSSGPGSGIGTSWIVLCSSGVGWTITSFMLLVEEIL